MKKLIKALTEKKRMDLVKAIKKIRRIPIEQKDILRSRIKNSIEIEDDLLEKLLTDVLTMTTPAHNQLIEYMSTKYGLSIEDSNLIADIMRDM